MASESTSPADLSAIPSSVSGDGTTFVKGLKKYLEKYDSNVDAKISNIGEGSVNQVTGLSLTEEHTTNENGNVNNIRVRFDNTNVSDYAFAQIWIKVDGVNAWVHKGNTTSINYLIEGVATGTKYFVKVVACNNNAGYADFEEAPVSNITIRGSVLLCDTPKQFYWSNSDKKWHWSGYTDNGYTDFFEIRTDQNAGVWNEHRLDAIPAGTYYSTVMPTTRSGTAYLYVRNVFGQYNTPATHQYSITAPAKPNKPTLEAVTDGVKVTLQGLPSGCTNYVVDVDGVEYEVLSSPWTSYTFFGSITVKYCFVDSVGRGPWSDSNSITTGRYIEATEITDGAISTPKLAANAITAAKINVNDINTSSILANSIKGDRIKAGTLDASKITAGSIVVSSKESEDSGIVTIKDGAINGSKITAASIIGDKIAANTISASKLKAETITLSNALKIVGGSVTLDGNGLKLTKSNGYYTLFNSNGINFYTNAGVPYSAIHRMCIGEAAHGKYVRFREAWESTPKVICMPTSIQCNESNYAQSNVYLICRATNVTVNGFNVECYTQLGDNSGATITYNQTFASTDSYAITPPTNATKAIFHCNITTVHGTSSEWAEANDNYYDSYGGGYIEIYNNGSKVSQTAEAPYAAGSYPHGTWAYTYRTTSFDIDVTASAFTNLTFKFVATGSGGTCTLSTVGYNSGVPTTISTGTATFVAIENNTNDYTVE